jgi:hypothetical protein
VFCNFPVFEVLIFTLYKEDMKMLNCRSMLPSKRRMGEEVDMQMEWQGTSQINQSNNNNKETNRYSTHT